MKTLIGMIASLALVLPAAGQGQHRGAGREEHREAPQARQHEMGGQVHQNIQRDRGNTRVGREEIREHNRFNFRTNVRTNGRIGPRVEVFRGHRTFVNNRVFINNRWCDVRHRVFIGGFWYDYVIFVDGCNYYLGIDGCWYPIDGFCATICD